MGGDCSLRVFFYKKVVFSFSFFVYNNRRGDIKVIKNMEYSNRKKFRLHDSMNSVARSASRIIRLHNLFSQVPPEEQNSLKSILKSELRIMLMRIFKLYTHLLIYIKKG